jgi:hypothetical protein
MAKMGRYCKAYPVTRLREFSGWSENAQNTRKEKRVADGKELELPRILTDSDHLYVQENHVVTDGVFIDENIVFDNVTPEWMDFCKNALRFQIPSHAAVTPPDQQ